MKTKKKKQVGHVVREIDTILWYRVKEIVRRTFWPGSSVGESKCDRIRKSKKVQLQLYLFILRKYQLKVFKCALQQISPYPFPTHPIPQRTTATPGTSCPTFLKECAGSLTSHIEVMDMESICETGPPFYSPYPRRLESLTICRCNCKGSTFSSVILGLWVVVRPESNSPPSSTNWVTGARCWFNPNTWETCSNITL